MNSLSDLPNIGKTFEKKLIKVGISTPMELKIRVAKMLHYGSGQLMNLPALICFVPMEE